MSFTPSIAQDRPAGSRVVAVAASQPERRLSAAELGEPFGVDGTWVTRRTGITELRRGESEAELLDHARSSAFAALKSANLEPSDIDLLLVATCSLNVSKCIAHILAANIAPRAAAMDINAACSGFSYALDVGNSAIRVGSARHVLIVAVEWMSGLIDKGDLPTSIIFGDGAAAAVMSAVDSSRNGVWPAAYGSAGDGCDLIRAIETNHGLRLRMDGREVFRWATESVPALVAAACARASIATTDIQVLVLHQANLRIIEAVVRQLELAACAIVLRDVERSGNTSAASIPIALSTIAKSDDGEGRLTLLAGFGAGLTYSAQVIRLP